MSKQKQFELVSVRAASNAQRRSVRAHWRALSLIAAWGLAGCAANAAPSEAETDTMGPGSGEPVGTAKEAYTSGTLDTDSVKVTGSQIDFGGSIWGIGSPVGSGTLTWSVLSGFYTPHLVGTMHVDGANGMYARMHVSHWDAAGNWISTEHSGTKHVSGSGHQSWPIDMTPLNLSQITEAHVCTELSNDGVTFWQVACESYFLNE